MLLVFGWLGYEIYREPGKVSEVTNVGGQSIDDLMNWGMMKLGNDNLEKKKQFSSFAEEMLLAADDDDEDDEEEDENQD